MSEGPPPEKRARHSQSENASFLPHPSLPQLLVAFKRHDEFWLEDGNLILIAKKDTAFRVYRGLLATQSAVFASSVASATSDPAQMCDGFPVVEVSDTPQELAHFLRVVLPKSQQVFYRRYDDPELDFDSVSAVIRLAHKYKVDDVKAQGITLLKQSRFSDDWDAWDTRDLHPTLVARGSYAIGAVNLARQTDTTSLLPVALYECVRLGRAVLDGWKRDDGVVEHLSAQDMAVCLRGRDALVREAATMFVQIFPNKPCKRCTFPDCQQQLRAAKAAIFLEDFPSHLVFDSAWVPWDMECDYDVCRDCFFLFHDNYMRERDRLWRRLPGIFGLEVKEWS